MQKFNKNTKNPKHSKDIKIRYAILSRDFPLDQFHGMFLFHFLFRGGRGYLHLTRKQMFLEKIPGLS